MVVVHPKSKEVERLFERLTRYPLQMVDPKVAQSLSRYKSIRCLNRPEKHIVISKGVVGLKPNVKVRKSKYGFEIDIF